MTTTHLGVVLPNDGADIASTARHAEAVGLDGVWAGDHLMIDIPYLSSTAVLAAAAAATERISVGWSVLLPALRPVAWAAKDIASVQQISAGRLQLGVGVGQRTPEWDIAGLGADGRATRTDALLTALPDLLAGRTANPFPGADGPSFRLLPAVSPPPLWIGGGADGALRRVVRFGAGWLAAMLPPEHLARRVADLAALTPEDAAPPKVGTMVFAAPSENAAGPDATRPVVDFLTRAYGLDQATAAGVAVGGPPEQLAEQLARYRDAGADTLIVVPFSRDTRAGYSLLGEVKALL